MESRTNPDVLSSGLDANAAADVDRHEQGGGSASDRLPLIWLMGIRSSKSLYVGVLFILMGLAIMFGVRAAFQSEQSPNQKKSVQLASGAAGPWQKLLESRSGRSSSVALPRAFHALRTKSETLSPGLEVHVEQTLEAPTGALQADRAQYIESQGEGMWLIGNKTQGVMCLVQASQAAVTCGTSSEVLAHGLALGVFNAPVPPAKVPSEFLILGVAPDWARFVQLRVGKSTPTVRVDRGTYSLRASTPITLLRLRR